MSNYPIHPVFADHHQAAAWGCWQCGWKTKHVEGREVKWYGTAKEYILRCPHCGAGRVYQVVEDFRNTDQFQQKLDEARSNYAVRRIP
jgi:predicted  nucleic acid-binding Zn-ribbon protein